MKNNQVTDLWIIYKNSLNDTLIRKISKIEKSIEIFENEGYQLETMSQAESKHLSSIIGNGLSYSSTVNYCCMLNKFLKMYEDKYNVRCEKVYADKSMETQEFYYSEDEFLDSLENHIDKLVESEIQNKSIGKSDYQDLRDSYLSGICLLILRWYGLTISEISQIKITDVTENSIILPKRTKYISERAMQYVNRYKYLNEITHFWRNPVRHDLPNSGYLFRKERIKKNENSLEPVQIPTLVVLQHRITKDSDIKKYVGLSAAYCTITEKTSEPINLCDRVRDYLGEEVISDMNIKKGWKSYLNGIELEKHNN